MEHTKHIWRAAMVLLVLVVAGIVTRHFLIPASFGQQGFYRYASLEEFMAQTPVHAGPRSCVPCHQEQAGTHSGGAHASVSCESCHAPLPTHARDGDKIADMPADPSPSLCAYCHQKLLARPQDMPQVDYRDHLEEQVGLEPGQEATGAACTVCHEAHDPAME